MKKHCECIEVDEESRICEECGKILCYCYWSKCENYKYCENTRLFKFRQNILRMFKYDYPIFCEDCLTCCEECWGDYCKKCITKNSNPKDEKFCIDCNNQ